MIIIKWKRSPMEKTIVSRGKQTAVFPVMTEIRRVDIDRTCASTK